MKTNSMHIIYSCAVRKKNENRFNYNEKSLTSHVFYIIIMVAHHNIEHNSLISELS